MFVIYPHLGSTSYSSYGICCTLSNFVILIAYGWLLLIPRKKLFSLQDYQWLVSPFFTSHWMVYHKDFSKTEFVFQFRNFLICSCRVVYFFFHSVRFLFCTNIGICKGSTTFVVSLFFLWNLMGYWVLENTPSGISFLNVIWYWDLQ